MRTLLCFILAWVVLIGWNLLKPTLHGYDPTNHQPTTGDIVAYLIAIAICIIGGVSGGYND